MRWILAIMALTLFALPASGWASESAPGDGTLSVTAATGSVSIAARGALIGQLDRGSVTLTDPDPKDGKPRVVWGYESRRDLSDTKSLYSGTDVRFRIIGGFFRAKVSGSGMDLSLVGRGSVSLAPTVALFSSGSYSTNGGLPLPFPDVLTTLQLSDAGPGG